MARHRILRGDAWVCGVGDGEINEGVQMGDGQAAQLHLSPLKRK